MPEAQKLQPSLVGLSASCSLATVHICNVVCKLCFCIIRNSWYTGLISFFAKNLNRFIAVGSAASMSFLVSKEQKPVRGQGLIHFLLQLVSLTPNGINTSGSRLQKDRKTFMLIQGL